MSSVWNSGSRVWSQRYSSMSWFRHGHTNYVNVNKVCYSRCLRGVVVPMLMHRPLSFFFLSLRSTNDSTYCKIELKMNLVGEVIYIYIYT